LALQELAPTATAYNKKKSFSTEEKEAYAQKKQDEMNELFERINKGVLDVFNSESFKSYLKFCSKFHDYSMNNTVLIAMQKPEATLVAGYSTWKQLGRQVESGQKGISILAPVVTKTNHIFEYTTAVLDEKGNKVYNSDGTEQTETVEKAFKELRFKKAYVFDVSQTSGKELPQLLDTELSGDVPKDKKECILNSLAAVAGTEITFEDIQSGAKGYYSHIENKIAVKTGMSDLQTLKTAFHETAHCLLHDTKKDTAIQNASRNDKELQAESVAFIVASHFDMDTSEYSFPYIAAWSDSGKPPIDKLKNVLTEIQKASKMIISQVDEDLLKLEKAKQNEAENKALPFPNVGIKQPTGVLKQNNEAVAVQLSEQIHSMKR
jgi:Zn-dependent peptidase ImmA (M78 family)